MVELIESCVLYAEINPDAHTFYGVALAPHMGLGNTQFHGDRHRC